MQINDKNINLEQRYFKVNFEKTNSETKIDSGSFKLATFPMTHWNAFLC